jgi:phospho-N-acetylmuramoyl-pentapeptide-transferase
LLIGISLFFGAIGSADDIKKIRKGNSRGLSAREKLVLQVLGAAMVGVFLLLTHSHDGILSLPFFKSFHPDLGWWYLPFAVLVIVGASNAVNLTDGLDGLAIGLMVIASGAMTVLSYVSGHAQFANYLGLTRLAGSAELTIFCASLTGASIGFLWFNAHPAEMFMGDVGALALGGSMGVVAVLLKQEILLLFIGGVYVIELLSVVIQVTSFKLTGKRVFLMAPLHHHFEKKGWNETQVVVRFWIAGLVMALFALTTLKLR